MAEISKQALAVANNTDFPDNNSGAITPAILRSYNVDVIDSTVNQTVYTSNSSSWNSSISQLNSFTSSQQPTFNALNAFTASQLTINTGVNAATQSLSASIAGVISEVDAIQVWTSSVNEIIEDNVSKGYATRFNFGGLITASITLNVDGPIADITVNSDPTSVTTSSFNELTQSVNSILDYTASLKQAITVNGTSASIAGNLDVVGTITAREIHTIIESSSVIFSSGSNVLGDADTDTQTLNGKVSISNGLTVTGNITASGDITVSGNVDGVDISSFYTITNAFTSSANTKFATIGALTGSFATTGSNTFNGAQSISGAVSATGNGLFGDYASNQYPALQTKVSTTTNPGNIYSTVGIKNDSDAVGSAGIYASTFTSFGSGLVTGIYGGGTGNKFKGDGGNTAIYLHDSIMEIVKDTKVSGSLAVSSSLTVNGTSTVSGSFLTNGGATFGNASSQYNNVSVVSSLANYPGNLFNSIGFDVDGGGQYSAGMFISTYTGFGSNTAFGIYGGGVGNAGDNNILTSYGNLARINKNTEITGSATITGSVYGNIVPLTISSQTASMDLSKGNFFTLTLVSGSSTHLTATNIKPGQTINLKLSQPVASYGTIAFPSYFDFAGGLPVSASAVSGAVDILSFVTFDTTSIYTTIVKNLS